ncbi:HIT family protein [Bacteroidota bacterium]
MTSIFTKIINREIPAYIVAEDDEHIAILDINPLVKGHTLVIPKMEIDYLFEFEDSDYLALNIFTKKVALAIEKVVPCLRMGTAVIGLEVPHCHIHLVPLNSMDDINFSRPKLKLTQGEFEEITQSINKEFEKAT